ncbi:serine/threonine protein kinase [Ancylobacter dichloromethanicus]|uniref:Serine/threonine protein kinase n=1 Tax=Ancylobacter dichloromethanicus TaxID=518825 RepID=A0A9W6MYF1_9HYPH|nr:serine/threonine protein kinase [Ancylobacter dichloromethanicus]MBS7553957.1 serine/threonine protein kinase [Ancylobacter dichloromethanicus]GLK71068.1 serine/threonine protein kinase [Ancylobacter dichloromethanicus]
MSLTVPARGGVFELDTVLKRDTFSTIERGLWRDAAGNVFPAVRRNYAGVKWWVKPLARHFAAREARALIRAEGSGHTVPVYALEEGHLVRGFVDGIPLQIAKPRGDLAYFASARKGLREVHRRGIAHNDLAKPQNWLYAADGRAVLMDFQLAMVFSRRSKAFRVAAYEDIRHFLKQKRSYCPEALTAREKKILARKSLFTRVWMQTGKKLYNFVTRRLLNYHDTEGRGPRAMEQGPRLAGTLAEVDGVRAVHVCDFPTAGHSFGLYAFVEAADGVNEEALRAHLAARLPDLLPPEHVQVVPALPRDGSGAVRDDLLRLVALNQLDQLSQRPQGPQEEEALTLIIRDRRNLSDRVRGGI